MKASNWKTTLGGVAAILGGIVTIIHGVTVSPTDTSSIMAGGTAIAGGIGLLFAKDFNVTNAAHPSDAKNIPE